MAEPSPGNRLGAQTSPYLLQHADNPVDWHPWDEQALERARHRRGRGCADACSPRPLAALACRR